MGNKQHVSEKLHDLQMQEKVGAVDKPKRVMTWGLRSFWDLDPVPFSGELFPFKTLSLSIGISAGKAAIPSFRLR